MIHRFVYQLKTKTGTDIDNDANIKQKYDKWINVGEKTKGSLILYILPSKLKQIKNCEMSSNIGKNWRRLNSLKVLLIKLRY